jgi:shikimate dehydrogenase
MSRFVLLGHPVSHSVSPEIHSAAYRALGLSHRYELVDCPDAAAFEVAISELRQGLAAGANVTLPHKARALALADDADALARETDAANVLVRRDGGIVAYNTDVIALVDELAVHAPSATSAVIFGAGGAARAAVSACRARGLREITVVARRFSAAEPLSRIGVRQCAWPTTEHANSALADQLSGADLLIQATSAGMRGGPPGEVVADLVPWERVPASALAYDVVYTPAVTPFLDAARRRGLGARGGLGMLVGQAAAAIRVWLDVEPPLREMEAAARRALRAEA